MDTVLLAILLVLLAAVVLLIVFMRIRRQSRGRRAAPPRRAPAGREPPAPAAKTEEPAFRSVLRETGPAPARPPERPSLPPPEPIVPPVPPRPTIVSRAEAERPVPPPAKLSGRAEVVTTAGEPGPERPIQVLVVDDVRDTREGVSTLLQFEKDIQVVGVARTGREGLEAARELKPDIVLMDINMPDMDGVTAAETITRELPQSQLIMMSVQSDSDYLRRSMLAGARDFLIKPFAADDLVSTIRRVYTLGATRPRPGAPAPAVGPAGEAQKPAGARRGWIIVVFSPQPGAGCTTLATNLAVAIQQMGNQKVGLVDGNFQFGDVGLYLNLQAGKSIADLVSSLDDLDPEYVEDIMVPHSSGLRVLLAPPRPEMADLVTPDALRRILTTTADAFDVIVVDSWPFLQEATLVLLELCDRLVLVVTPEVPTVKNVKLFLDVLDSIQFPSAKIALVLNRVDPRAGLDPADIERSIQHAFTGQISANWRLATYAANRGMPFTISHRDSNLAQDVAAVASAVMTRGPTAEAAADA